MLREAIRPNNAREISMGVWGMQQKKRKN